MPPFGIKRKKYFSQSRPLKAEAPWVGVTARWLWNPFGITSDQAGNLYVAEQQSTDPNDWFGWHYDDKLLGRPALKTCRGWLTAADRKIFVVDSGSNQINLTKGQIMNMRF